MAGQSLPNESRPCPKDGGKIVSGLLSDELVDDVALLVGGGGGGCREAAETGGTDGEGAEAAVLGGAAFIDFGGHDRTGIIYGYQYRDLAGAHAAVGRDGEFAGLSPFKIV